jgi:hypothetical protein
MLVLQCSCVRSVWWLAKIGQLDGTCVSKITLDHVGMDVLLVVSRDDWVPRSSLFFLPAAPPLFCFVKG